MWNTKCFLKEKCLPKEHFTFSSDLFNKIFVSFLLWMLFLLFMFLVNQEEECSLFADSSQKNDVVFKADTKFIFSDNYPSFRCICIRKPSLWVQSPKWCHSRRKLFVCSVFWYIHLLLQCSVNFMDGWRKTCHTQKTNRWYWQLVETRCLCKSNCPGQPHESAESVERMRGVSAKPWRPLVNG